MTLWSSKRSFKDQVRGEFDQKATPLLHKLALLPPILTLAEVCVSCLLIILGSIGYMLILNTIVSKNGDTFWCGQTLTLFKAVKCYLESTGYEIGPLWCFSDAVEFRCNSALIPGSDRPRITLPLHCSVQLSCVINSDESRVSGVLSIPFVFYWNLSLNVRSYPGQRKHFLFNLFLFFILLITSGNSYNIRPKQIDTIHHDVHAPRLLQNWSQLRNFTSRLVNNNNNNNNYNNSKLEQHRPNKQELGERSWLISWRTGQLKIAVQVQVTYTYPCVLSPKPQFDFFNEKEILPL